MLVIASSPVARAQAPQAVSDCEGAFDVLLGDAKLSKNFDPFFRFYQNNRECDDGAFAAGISSAVSESLDRNWDRIAELKKLFNDKGFEKFFYSHVEALVSASEPHLNSVIKKSKVQCPKGQKPLCKQLSAAAKRALAHAKATKRKG